LLIFVFFLLISLIILKLIRILSIDQLHLSTSINPELSTYLQIQLSPSGNFCRRLRKKIVFSYVLSAVSNFEFRKFIRKTWGKSNNVAFVFVIGLTTDKLLQKMIQIEQTQHNDLLQGNFEDTYRNLSYKSLTAWKWMLTNCDMNAIRFVIKLDDDVILNVNVLDQVIDGKINLLRFQIHSASSKITTIDLLKNSFVCHVFAGYTPDNNTNSKYYVRKSEYNSKLYGMDHYSEYCFGPGFIATTDLIEKLYAQSLQVKLFWLDDVYVGILARYALASFKYLDKSFYLEYSSRSHKNKTNFKNRLFIRNIDTPSDFKKILKLINA